MSIPELAKNFQAVVEGLGKTIWVFLLGYIAVAITFGSASMLGAIGTRLQLAGFTTLKTPVGDVDPRQIGRLAESSQKSAVNVAVLQELAASSSNPATRKVIEDVAASVQQQQDLQIRVVQAIAGKSQVIPGPSATTPSDFHERWIFVGRRTERGWSPLSFTLGEVGYPVRIGMKLPIKSESLLYQDADCNDKPEDSPRYEAVRATALGVEVVSDQVLCPSISNSSTVWVKVKVPGQLFVSR